MRAADSRSSSLRSGEIPHERRYQASCVLNMVCMHTDLLIESSVFRVLSGASVLSGAIPSECHQCVCPQWHDQEPLE